MSFLHLPAKSTFRNSKFYPSSNYVHFYIRITPNLLVFLCISFNRTQITLRYWRDDILLLFISLKVTMSSVRLHRLRLDVSSRSSSIDRPSSLSLCQVVSDMTLILNSRIFLSLIQGCMKKTSILLKKNSYLLLMNK